MRVLNLRNVLVFVGLATVGLSPANATSLIELGGQKSESSVLALGKAPEKKMKKLALGTLRFTSGVLPEARLTLQQRMQKRLELGRRQNARLDDANRQRLRALSRQNRVSEDEDVDEDNYEDEEDMHEFDTVVPKKVSVKKGTNPHRLPLN